MAFTKEEKEELIAEIKADLTEENKADVATITRLITERDTANETEKKALADKLKKLKEEYETKMNRPPLRSGMLPEVEPDLEPLVFQDAAGVEHKSLRVKDKLFEGKDEDFSIGKIIRAKILGDFTKLNDFETKAAGEGIGSLGGWLIGEEISARIIDLARNLSCVQEAGALTMPMSSPEMTIVKVTGDPSVSWLAEHGEITESDWSIAPISLKAMTIGCLVRASLEILEDAANSGQMLQNAMASALALEVDRVALLGAGVTEPRGLDKADGVNEISLGTNGAALANYDPFSNAVEDIADHNGPKDGLAVIFAPRTYYTLDRLKAATTNQPLVPPQSFIDLKKFVTNQIGVADTQGTCTTASKAFVGDFKNILYGIRKNIEVEFTRQGGTKTFAKCEALIRARMRLDVAILRENFFTKIVGIKV